MNKYKVGDKIVLEITDRFKNAYGHEYYSILDSVYSTEFIDEKSEPLRNYTEPLEAKIRRQAAEITRLLEENAEIQGLNNTICDICKSDEFLKEMAESAREEGQEEAWELARKIVLKNGYSAYDLHEIFNCCGSHQALEDYTYLEAAAKVEAWEKAKEEIKVGDVVSHEEKNGVVISEGTICFRGFTDDGTPFEWYKERCTKTGRHIDIDSFLKQIRGKKK